MSESKKIFDFYVHEEDRRKAYNAVTTQRKAEFLALLETRYAAVKLPGEASCADRFAALSPDEREEHDRAHFYRTLEERFKVEQQPSYSSGEIAQELAWKHGEPADSMLLIEHGQEATDIRDRDENEKIWRENMEKKELNESLEALKVEARQRQAYRDENDIHKDIQAKSVEHKNSQYDIFHEYLSLMELQTDDYASPKEKAVVMKSLADQYDALKHEQEPSCAEMSEIGFCRQDTPRQLSKKFRPELSLLML